MRAVPQRKAEFRAARHAFRQALDVLGEQPAALLAGTHREPLWPEGMVGAITHTGNFCAVALARSPEWTGIAIDAEDSQPLSPDLLSIICRPEESARLSGYRRAGLQSPCKLMFSAKECVHKIFFPLNRHTLEFTDARIELDVERKLFMASIINPPARVDVPLAQMYGRFAVDGQRLYTAIEVKRIDRGMAQC